MNKLKIVGEHGATAGSVLFGTSSTNRGLRLRVTGPQTKGDVGPVRGGFVLLDVGDNKHTDSLSGLLGLETDAAEVLRVLREISPFCVNVVNLNILAVEGQPTPRH